MERETAYVTVSTTLYTEYVIVSSVGQFIFRTRDIGYSAVSLHLQMYARIKFKGILRSYEISNQHYTMLLCVSCTV